jgi:hypothetical protein
MLLYVKMTNFRGLSCQLDFGDPDTGVFSRVRLSGKNGSRKTTVREAVSFLFTGRDSLGTPKPTHLISTGEEGCEVEARTRRGALIIRSLTQKGGGSLRMDIGGERRQLTQSEFEAMLCPGDVFLSVFAPGFLLSQLPKNRQSAVLSYILPPVDRVAYMKSAVGEKIADLDYSKRPDILQKQLADERNRISHGISEMQGELRSLRAKLGEPREKPRVPPEIALFDLQDDLRRQWDEYDRKLAAYSQACHDLRIKKEENVKIAKEREAAEAALRQLSFADLPVPPLAFTLECPPPPQKPLLQHEEDRDRCPSCGQVVGLKHREIVRAQNEKLNADYLEAYAAWAEKKGAWEAARAEWALARKSYEEQHAAVSAVNQKVGARRAELDRALEKTLLFHRLPESDPIPPKKPAEEFSQERYAELKQITQSYYRDLGAFDAWQAMAKEAEGRIKYLEQSISQGEELVQWHRENEEALRLLPSYELMEQKAHLKMPAGYELTVDEGLQLFDRTGCPYELLSRGQKMHADFEICLKVNALLSRKVGMVFLDDFDLADWKDLLKEASETVQIFTAHVDPGAELRVELSNPVRT